MSKNHIRIFLFIQITIIGFILTMQTAFAENLKKGILGKWNLIGTTETIEFFEDGTIIFNTGKESFVGDYKFLDETRIRIDFSGMGGIVGSQVTKISKDKERITLDKLFDKKLELTKMTESRQFLIAGLVLLQKENYKEAADLLEKAAKKGESEAQDRLGLMYYKGTGVEKNYESAYNWFYEAANQGVASSQVMLGHFYDKGYGTNKDIEKAISWFKKAADKGNLSAMNGLAWIYATSDDPKYRNGERALEFAQMAYSQNKDTWYILDTLAAAYARSGQFDKAVDYCKKSIDLLKWNYNLSKDEKQKYLDKADVKLSLYKNNTAYDESYDIDKAIVERKAEQKKAEIERKQAQEAAKNKQRKEYEKQLAEQKKIREEALEQKKKKEARIAALKAEYTTPTKILTTFDLEGNGKQVKGEIKDTELRWMTRYIPRRQKGKDNNIKKSSMSLSEWKETVFWFGKINSIRIVDRSSKNMCCSLSVNTKEIICCDKAEIQKFYNELIDAISLWYDKYSELFTKKPGFLSKKISLKDNEASEPISHRDKSLVINIQKELKALGYYKGEIDGIFGGGTASAIKTYQQDSNLKPDGMPSKELLAHLENRINNSSKRKQNETIQKPKNPKTLEETVNKTVDGLLKAIFKTN